MVVYLYHQKKGEQNNDSWNGMGRYIRRSAWIGSGNKRGTGRGLKPSSAKNKKSIDKISIWTYNKGTKDKENNKSKRKGERRNDERGNRKKD